MKIILNRGERVSFWFPIVLPVVMGLVYGFAALTADLGGTALAVINWGLSSGSTLKLSEWLTFDLLVLWDNSCIGIVTSIFAIDIWALTMLFASQVRWRTATAIAYPVVGMFAHFVLLLAVVGTTEVGDAMHRAQVTRAENARAEQEQTYTGSSSVTYELWESQVELVTESEAQAKLEKKPESGAKDASGGKKDDAALWAMGLRLTASLMTLLSVITGWFVRRGVWIHHESQSNQIEPDGKSLAPSE